MLKIFKSGCVVSRGFRRTVVQKRSFLSEAYRCEEAWKARLQSSLLQKYDPQNLFVTLDHKYTSAGKVSAVDIDIFANSIVEKNQIDELMVLLQNLRQSAETTNTLDSTHHAVIRYLLDHDYTNELMRILHNRLDFGIFPDHLCYNILMDTYIKRKDYANAAKVAVLPMLQEDYMNPITNALSVYACHMYLQNPDTWQKPLEPEDDHKEEIKIRVRFLRNPYFDDHFDLTDPYDLVGKTLVFQGRAMDDTLGRTCQLRGLILYKKYQDASKLISQWLNVVKGDVIYDETFNLIEKDNENMYKEEAPDELKQLMLQVNELKQKGSCKDSLIEALKNNVKSAVDKQHDVDIKEQLELYSKWDEKRHLTLENQIKEINRQARIENIEKMKKDLKLQERVLTFFENEEQIELEIEKKEALEKAELERVMRMPRGPAKLQKLKQQDEYVPPQIIKRKN
ncbi:28S ribosomal protein S27, mitochondrial [Anthophora quadrimaculata]